jgi:NAD(P)-dependent dehydrogenase (short-subunit alcohol dehydrogenase family)
MADEARVAVVTGANRGLGLEACRQLARLGLRTVLTSRDADKGEQAAAALRKEGLDVTFRVLDVCSDAQVVDFAAYADCEFERVDVLINNAGIFPDASGPTGTGASVFNTQAGLVSGAFDTNVLGAMRLCNGLLPLMRRNAYGRIVNVSSGMGQLSDMGGSYPGYRISKTALNALTRILAAELADSNIKVNSMCPGWVRTDMGGPNADRSPEEGVDTSVWLATLPDDGPSGGFFRDRREIPW